ncbi:recombinase family protein [bacterium]|nr:recombinase family protein [bacterium]
MRKSIGANRSSNEPRAVIGYTRVSTEEQAREGLSLEAQELRIRQWAELYSHQVEHIYSDPGISGHRLSNRPQAQAALDRVCETKGILVVYALSRISRSTIDCIDIAARLEKAGADFVSISQSLDTSSPTGKFIYRVLAAVGELERDQISERVTEGMAVARAKGRRISRHLPYGYTASLHGELIEVEVEQLAIVRMHEARDAGAGFREIARMLENEKIPTKRGGRWSAKTVRGILEFPRPFESVAGAANTASNRLHKSFSSGRPYTTTPAAP